jgi:hypothetical protein
VSASWFMASLATSRPVRPWASQRSDFDTKSGRALAFCEAFSLQRLPLDTIEELHGASGAQA